MSAQLNHTIILCRDKVASAGFLAGILGRPAPLRSEPFEVVALDNAVTLDFMETGEPVTAQHYAFLIDEADFDGVFGRVEANGDYWADPARRRPGEINHRGGGRGCYFLDPNGHLLEVLTRA